MRTRNALLFLISVVFLFLLAIGGCGRQSSVAEPTRGLNPTQSFETAVARVTQIYLETASAGGTITASDTPEPEVTPSETPAEGTPSATPAPPTARPTNTPVPCDKAAPGNPIDVTIPDDTVMAPETAFTKTWRLINSGTCTWTNQYAVVWVSGAQIGNQDVVFLNGSVAPGQQVDISVPMTAPEDTGTFQSNWKLRNAAGVMFGIGDEGDSVFWARIKVVTATATPTATPTATATVPAITATATPSVFATNTVNMVPSDTLDLDNVVVNGGGTDLNYSIDASSNHLLSPVNGARIGVFGASKPGLQNCLAASLGSAPLAIESVGVGTFLCYQTDSGRFGWLQIGSFNPSDGALSVTALTWAASP